jgi:hypothetical protein
MVWVTLFDGEATFLGYVQLHALPIAKPDDYRCMPHGTLTFKSAVLLSEELRQGCHSGQIGGLQWRRQTDNYHDPAPVDRE